MGRGKGKGKKFSMTNNKDGESGEEEKIPVQKKRGRPQNSLKSEEIDGEDFDKKEVGESENTKESILSSKKRQRSSSQGREKIDLGKMENGFGNESIKLNGFRRSGSRRKNRPHRAAEVGVECNP